MRPQTARGSELWCHEGLQLDHFDSGMASKNKLRAATSLARWRGDQGKSGEARDLLAPVYSWFTEGLDTAELKHASALLDELS